MKVKSLIPLVVAACFCGCSTNKPLKTDSVIDIIESQKVLPVNGDLKSDGSIDLYYLGWNDSADNIAHHLIKK